MGGVACCCRAARAAPPPPQPPLATAAAVKVLAAHACCWLSALSSRTPTGPGTPAAWMPAAAAQPGKEGIVRDAYRFLQRQGAINFGLLRGDPRVPLPPELARQVAAAAAAAAAAGGGQGEEGGGAGPGVTDEQVAETLFDIMGAVDMTVRWRPRLPGWGHPLVVASGGRAPAEHCGLPAGRRRRRRWAARARSAFALQRRRTQPPASPCASTRCLSLSRCLLPPAAHHREDAAAAGGGGAGRRHV